LANPPTIPKARTIHMPSADQRPAMGTMRGTGGSQSRCRSDVLGRVNRAHRLWPASNSNRYSAGGSPPAEAHRYLEDAVDGFQRKAGAVGSSPTNNNGRRSLGRVRPPDGIFQFLPE
jgi:hypothetical protein